MMSDEQKAKIYHLSLIAHHYFYLSAFSANFY